LITEHKSATAAARTDIELPVKSLRPAHFVLDFESE
jgi:hypothetical protein